MREPNCKALPFLLILLIPFLSPVAAFRRVIYAPNWAQYRRGAVGGATCQWVPADIRASNPTHIVYSFAWMRAGKLQLHADFSIRTTEWNDLVLMAQLRGLKRTNPSLRTLLAVGGWSFTEGATRPLFSNMVSTQANRRRFINDVLAFTQQHGFNGIDIDWEYPGVGSRGGRAADRGNLVRLVRELRAAANAARRPGFLITMAIPACTVEDNFNCRGFNWANLTPSINFYNLMAYDYAGSWTGRTGFNAPWFDPLGGASISKSLDYLLRQRVPRGRINLGLAAYGRAWFLQNANAPNRGLGAPTLVRSAPEGSCTRSPGFLAWYEIKQQIARSGTGALTIDSTAMSAFLRRGNGAWISFDLPQTLFQKIQAARRWGVGGLMMWEGSLDDGQQTLGTLMRTLSNPGPYVRYREWQLQIVLTGGSPGSITTDQRKRLANWNAGFAGVPGAGQAATTNANSLTLTWISTRSGEGMTTRANSRFALRPCPSPPLAQRAAEVERLLAPLGLRVRGFNLIGISPAPDNVRRSFSLASLTCPRGAAGDSASAAADRAAALQAEAELVAAAVQAAAEAGDALLGVVAAPAQMPTAQWQGLLRAARGNATSGV